ncbi:MAG: hypothetical protein MJ016_07470 [Victivallaceae bacterium]|nr:hypothetical protein [Victivallaceae bacterium]
MKRFCFVLLVAFLLLLVNVAVCLLARDAIAETVLEIVGGRICGVPVDIIEIQSTLSGRIEIRGVTIANRPGYVEQYACKIDRGIIDLNMRQWWSSGRIVFDEIAIEGVSMQLEPNGSTSNLQEIRDCICADSTPEDDAEKDVLDHLAPPTEIRRFTARYNVVFAHYPIVKTPFVMPVQDMEMHDIGVSGNWTMRDTFNYVSDQMFLVALNAGRTGGAILAESATNTMEMIFTGTGNVVKKTFNGAVDAVAGVTQKTVSGAKGLWGGESSSSPDAVPEKK